MQYEFLQCVKRRKIIHIKLDKLIVFSGNNCFKEPRAPIVISRGFPAELRNISEL